MKKKKEQDKKEPSKKELDNAELARVRGGAIELNGFTGGWGN